MATLFPVFLKLDGQAVLIVGGGALGQQKVAALESTGARIAVVSPVVVPELERAAAAGTIRWDARSYVPSDLEGVAMVFAATGDVALNHRIVDEARALSILANAVDDPSYCDFYTPAVVRRSAFALAICSDGRFPGLTRVLREALDTLLPREGDGLLEELIAARLALVKSAMNPKERMRRLRAVVAKFKDEVLMLPEVASAASLREP